MSSKSVLQRTCETPQGSGKELGVEKQGLGLTPHRVKVR